MERQSAIAQSKTSGTVLSKRYMAIGTSVSLSPGCSLVRAISVDGIGVSPLSPLE